MNDLQQWLKQMEAPKGQQVPRKNGELPQGKDFDGDFNELPEMEGGAELGDEQPQGMKQQKELREVKYQKPGQQKGLDYGGQKDQQKTEKQNQKPQNQQNPQQMPPVKEEPTALEKMLELAMKQAEAEREQRKQEREQQNQQQQQQDSEKIQEHEQRLDNLEERVEVIEANYVGQETFQSGIDGLQGQLDKINQPKLINIEGRTPIEIKERTHPVFERLLQKMTRYKQAYLVGPAGSGKTTLASQVAKALGLRFGAISCSAGMAEAHLLGRMIANGSYIQSQLVDLYENGGVFLFDEVDAADANTMLVLNSALANGYMSVPNRADKPTAVRHPDFLCVVAANTLGTGSFEYHGRNYLDAAFLDRFALSRLQVNYDLELEREFLAGDAEFARLLHKMRYNLESSKTRRVLSTRVCRDAGVALLAGDTPQQVIDDVTLGWTQEEIQRAMKDVVVPKSSPLKQIGIKNAEREKTKRDQEAAAAKKAAKDLAKQAVQNRQEEVLEVIAEEVLA